MIPTWRVAAVSNAENRISYIHMDFKKEIDTRVEKWQIVLNHSIA